MEVYPFILHMLHRKKKIFLRNLTNRAENPPSDCIKWLDAYVLWLSIFLGFQRLCCTWQHSTINYTHSISICAAHPYHYSNSMSNIFFSPPLFVPITFFKFYTPIQDRINKTKSFLPFFRETNYLAPYCYRYYNHWFWRKFSILSALFILPPDLSFIYLDPFGVD